MNLPFILDIVIGLIFIYLILSLLSSELQELITTLLQWRAAHLKKSIEVLLSGDENDANKDATLVQSKKLLKEIYDHVLIKNISQRSRGGVEGWLRHVARAIVTLGRAKSGAQKDSAEPQSDLTLKGDEPSYIPAETFATVLLEKLELSRIVRDLTALKLKVLIERDILPGIDASLKAYASSDEAELNPRVVEDLQKSLDNLKKTFNEIHAAFRADKISLQTVVYRLKNELNNYVLKTTVRIQNHLQETTSTTTSTGETSSQTLKDVPNDHPLLEQIVSLQRGVFYTDESADYDNIDEVIRQLQPGLAEVLGVLKQEVNTDYEQYQEFKNAYAAIQIQAQKVSKDLPPSILESLTALSRRAEINLQRTKDQVELLQDELQQFKVEIQNWFDRSMDRASGVYKRNAKGVGFLIGLVLAIALNADTFHIVTRLTADSTLRDALVSSAEVISSRCGLPNQPRPADPTSQVVPTPTQPTPSPAEQPSVRLPQNSFTLPFEQPAFAQAAPDASSSQQSPEDCITDAVQQATTLPLGWNQQNLDQQAAEAQESVVPFLAPVRKLLGWAVTGLAIAMGASFWFDLLNKVVNVRYAGKRPESKVDTDASRSE